MNTTAWIGTTAKKTLNKEEAPGDVSRGAFPRFKEALNMGDNQEKKLAIVAFIAASLFLLSLIGRLFS
ncbi:hypothetical protein SAMN05421781_0790 [Marinococcus luteus]|uniref:Uncharacterized protein n=1 Tax=Marinococcus luteus TaxID=1122204 RepID=A0A1H2RIU3_9BACI|nr:hypothetical protein SAMN05421781_0790 [Marinococcus luteus]